MSEVEEYRCFVGSLSWSTTDGSLKEAFQEFGHLTKAKIVLDKFSGRSHGFGFVTFDAEDVITAMRNFGIFRILFSLNSKYVVRFLVLRLLPWISKEESG
ncbi:hypothetical protein ZIOFF_013744 [Zingiber officinale]|uniref:RRM domain-containing protein n=1 Tax=Zingiber officinale TaxID=94328 RepID=A0A8J5HGF5_ZINOF|nr:hypothetical protein ZIOFF_013744 [Zingiber officinale]